MKFTMFDSIKNKIEDENFVKEIEESIKKSKSESKRIWFEPKKKEGTSQNVLNYYRQQQKKEFEL